jgi:hypothetical protein
VAGRRNRDSLGGSPGGAELAARRAIGAGNIGTPFIVKVVSVEALFDFMVLGGRGRVNGAILMSKWDKDLSQSYLMAFTIET